MPLQTGSIYLVNFKKASRGLAGMDQLLAGEAAGQSQDLHRDVEGRVRLLQIQFDPHADAAR